MCSPKKKQPTEGQQRQRRENPREGTWILYDVLTLQEVFAHSIENLSMANIINMYQVKM